MARERKRETPESLMGVYTPLHAAPAMMHFLSSDLDSFGTLNPIKYSQTGFKEATLMDGLVVAPQGYYLRMTATLLFNIYLAVNNLHVGRATFRPDERIMEAFGGTIPAGYYMSRDANGRLVKIPMEDAVARGIIPAPLNTFQVIQHLQQAGGLQFDINAIHFAFVQQIVLLNSYAYEYLRSNPTYAQVAGGLRRQDIVDAMIDDYYTAKRVHREWKNIREEKIRAERAQTRR